VAYFDYGVRDSLVGIATGHGLNVPGVLIPAGARYFLFSETAQTGSGAQLASYSKVTMCLLFCLFVGRPRQATAVLQPAGLLYRPLWAFQLLPTDAPAPTDAFRTLAAEVGTYGRE
jgi:hypothetical protein